ncbi:MAG: zf-HC2 domain-containing protein [Bacteroidota bacterium]
MNDHRTHQLDDYLDGALSKTDVAGVENHLRLCASCSTELKRMRRLNQKAANLPRSITPQRDLWAGIAERLSAHEQLSHPLDGSHPARASVLPRTGLGRWIRYGAALAAMIGFVTVGIWWLFLQPQSGWNLAVVKGSATLGSRIISGEGRMNVGERLETGNESNAKIQVGIIGHVDVAPNTSIRLLQASMTDHRLALDQGSITATIFAPPRLFFVETPSGLAVDLGCAYTLSVDDAGASTLHVTSGWVALEFDNRESIVPAGAICKTRAGFGPGTPYQEDASGALVGALAQYDFENGGFDALRVVIDEARNIDSITLWHLYMRTKGTHREAVYDRLSSLVPPPRGVTRDGMLAGDPEMIKLWRKYLNLGMDGWWRVL